MAESSGLVDRPVFLVGSGRCGSTLLQRILNSSPEFLIWGEHDGMLEDLAKAFYARTFRWTDDALDSAGRETQLRDPACWSAWANVVANETELCNVFRPFVRSIFCPKDRESVRWGFKEIRYGKTTADRTLFFLHRLFPQASTLVLVRDAFPTIRSVVTAWYRNRGLNAYRIDEMIRKTARRWTRLYERMYLFHHTDPSSSLIVRYEDLGLPAARAGIEEFLETQSPLDWDGVMNLQLGGSIRGDEFGALVDERLRCLERELTQIVAQVRTLYGYTDDPASRLCR